MELNMYTVARFCIILGIFSLVALLIAHFFRVVEITSLVPIFALLISLAGAFFILKRKPV
ncbi:hypothetical protein SH601_16510 [Gracilibacillus sp. S3-1-1]|uniref:Uncharacterized protein n=1 Tax=Gracilibacillus pellucidus TaxID=3095368 RepID=A0ACC6M9B2_9BACI|nr:hypothetical protein [Gracilibacillus sp. S3-1-1]MDX8047569.1 hypothetical protein [Gracilibacillus sp. S3-1-1]